MAFGNGPKIVTNGLVLALDAADKNSYPGSGTNWSDLSGNNNTGTLTNGPAFSSVNGGYINYDGTNDFADFGNIFNFTTQPFTFSYWLYCNSLTTNQAGQGPVIFYKGSYFTNGYYVQVDQTGALKFATNQSGATQFSSTAEGAILVNMWYNISHTRNGSSIITYINGINANTISATHINPENTGNSFRIANYQNGYIYSNIRTATFFTYNRALSQSEVLQNYNAQKSRFGL